MKKVLLTSVVCGLVLSMGSAMAADYSVKIGKETVDLGKNAVYEENKHLMLPLRAVAEKLGFKVDWNAERQSITLDNGEVNTIVYIGTDSYYMASSTAIGMSAPTALGAAPVLKNDVTYVPAEMFNVLNCGTAYEVKDHVITFAKEESTQIPNPLTEQKTIADAEKVLGFSAKLPKTLPDGFSESTILTISGKILDVRYQKGDAEIMYRMAKGADDISGDYKVYQDVKTVQANAYSVTLRKNDQEISAIWTDSDYTYALYADKDVSEQDVLSMIASIG